MIDRRMTRLVALLAVGFLMACQPASEPVAPSPEERINQHWAFMIAQDYAAAWEMYSPGFRQATPQHVFMAEMASRPIRVLDAQLVTLDCQAEYCDARLALNYRVLQGPPGISAMVVPMEIDERWILDGGQWWYLRR